jgi:hypothetical protein
MMSSEEYQAASGNDAGDNLQEIEGIGPGYARALNKIGIYRFADFLTYDTPEQIQQALEEAGEQIPLWKIKRADWFGQAKAKLLAQSVRELPSPEEELEAAEESQQSSIKGAWVRYAGFNLYFDFRTDEVGKQEWQTAVYKSLEPDNFTDKKEFEGIDPASWVNWILEKAELPESAQPVPVELAEFETRVTTPPALAIESVADIEILAVQAIVLPPSSGFPEKRLRAEVRFQLSGDRAEMLTAERVSFRVEVHTVDLESKASNLVASRQGQLQPGKFEYTSQEAFAIPELGRYELYSLVLLLPPAGMMAYHRGSTINVLP